MSVPKHENESATGSPTTSSGETSFPSPTEIEVVPSTSSATPNQYNDQHTEKTPAPAELEATHATSNSQDAAGGPVDSGLDNTDGDPLSLGQHKRPDTSRGQMKSEYPKAKPKRMKSFYNRQNNLIDQFLNSGDEERAKALDTVKNGPKVKFAIYASSVVNVCLFIIQLYAAVSTGSLALFATAADAFMDVVSSITMLITSRMASRPSVYKYPVGRTRIEVIGIILFCALMSTVAVELIVESGRSLSSGDTEHGGLQIIPLCFVGAAIASKGTLFFYCFALRRYPAARVFMYDHRNDLIVNIFGLVMSIVGNKFVWYLDPIGAILIGCLILFSWVSTAFEHVWLLVGKGAPKEFINKLVYMCVTHDERIMKVDTCRAYHAGQQYYVEVDIIMDPDIPLKIAHDVSQTLQRKFEGLADVERAFVHVDYEDEHSPNQEHKPLYERQKKRRSLKEAIMSIAGKEVGEKETPKEEKRISSGIQYMGGGY